MKGCARSVSGVVDGFTDSSDIAHMFADKYDEFYTNVPFDNDEMGHGFNQIDSRLKHRLCRA